LESLGRFDDPDLGKKLVALSVTLPADLHPAAHLHAAGPAGWTAELLRAIDAGTLPRTDLGTTQIQRVRQYDDPAVVALADKLVRQVDQGKPAGKMEQEVERVHRLRHHRRRRRAGRTELFTQRCAVCHTLLRQGWQARPDLTGYERRNVDFLVVSVVDPSAYIREEYTASASAPATVRR